LCSFLATTTALNPMGCLPTERSRGPTPTRARYQTHRRTRVVRLLRPSGGAALDTVLSDPAFVGAVIAWAGCPRGGLGHRTWLSPGGQLLASRESPACGKSGPPQAFLTDVIRAIQDCIAHDASLEEMLSEIWRGTRTHMARFCDFYEEHLAPAEAVLVQRQLTMDIFARMETVRADHLPAVRRPGEALGWKYTGSEVGDRPRVRRWPAGQRGDVTAQLGYDLGLRHLALVLSHEDPDPDDELVKVAMGLLR
jgi:hypothetical protein